MIEEEKVRKLVEEKLDGRMFLVELSVNEKNVINIFVDSFDGLTIDQCVNISRHVEHSLDREEEDFELQVSSPGLSESFKVVEQYHKYKGVLIDVQDDGFELETSSKEKLEGYKKKQVVIKKHPLKYEEIKSAKAIISFK